MVAARIKLLRDQRGMTQTELAKRLGITRSSVNAWEMGISVPSTQCRAGQTFQGIHGLSAGGCLLGHGERLRPYGEGHSAGLRSGGASAGEGEASTVMKT